jgi:hypothetical protein
MGLLPRARHGWVIDVRGQDWRFDGAGRMVNRRDPEAYDDCWCDSGRKFRFCHMRRDRQALVTRGEFLAGWEAAVDFETCWHPDAPVGCSEKIIRAHTVQRMGGGLRVIARDSEVYGCKVHPYSFQKHRLRVVPELTGLRKASTFRGFCGSHDEALFKPVEQDGFRTTPECLALLNFRAVAKRLHGRNVSFRHAPRMLGYDRGLSSDEQREWHAIHYREMINGEQALANTQHLKVEYDQRLQSSNFGDVNAYVLHFVGTPVFLSAELVRTDWTFKGESLSDPAPPAHLCAYNLSVAEGWAFVFSWAGLNRSAEKLCESLERLPNDSKLAAVFAYAIEYIDNTWLAPTWWESLNERDRETVVGRLTARMHPHYSRGATFVSHLASIALPGTFVRSEMMGDWKAA